MADFGAPRLDELLSVAEMSRLSSAAMRRAYRDGEVIHDRGDSVPAMGIVVSGRVRLVSPRSDGRENLVAIVSPGQNYGDVVVTSRKKRAHRAIAVGDTVVDHLDRAAFEPLLQDPALMRAFYVIAAHRLVLMLDMLDDMRALSPEVRLAKTLAVLNESSDNRVGFDFIQEDFANLLGISTVTLAKALKTLRAEGLVETGYRHLRISDPAKLAVWLVCRAVTKPATGTPAKC